MKDIGDDVLEIVSGGQVVHAPCSGEDLNNVIWHVGAPTHQDVCAVISFDPPVFGYVPMPTQC